MVAAARHPNSGMLRRAQAPGARGGARHCRNRAFLGHRFLPALPSLPARRRGRRRLVAQHVRARSQSALLRLAATLHLRGRAGHGAVLQLRQIHRQYSLRVSIHPNDVGGPDGAAAHRSRHQRAGRCGIGAGRLSTGLQAVRSPDSARCGAVSGARVPPRSRFALRRDRRVGDAAGVDLIAIRDPAGRIG